MLENAGLYGGHIVLIVFTCAVAITLISAIWLTIADEMNNRSGLGGAIVICIALLGALVWASVSWVQGHESNAAYSFEGPATYVGLQEMFEDGYVVEKPLIEVQGAEGVSGPQRMIAEDFRIASMEVGETIPVSCYWLDDTWNCAAK